MDPIKRTREQEADYAEICHQNQLLRELLSEIAPGVRDILWCALVWNDHNFDYDALREKATRAAKNMGINRSNGVDAVNYWMQRVDAALARAAIAEGKS